MQDMAIFKHLFMLMFFIFSVIKYLGTMPLTYNAICSMAPDNVAISDLQRTSKWFVELSRGFGGALVAVTLCTRHLRV